MRSSCGRAAVAVVGVAGGVLALAMGVARADAIRLREGETTLTGEVLRSDDDDVIVRLPRASISTINGKPLPLALVAGAVAPPFTAQDILGQSQSVGQGSGKVTVLHFWVDWCPHCRSDAPKIQALHDRFRDNPAVKVLTVNLDQDRAKLDEFLKEHHATYPVIFASQQAGGPSGVNIPELYQIYAFPVTYLIDNRGVIRRKVSGSFVESKLDLEALITELLPKS